MRIVAPLLTYLPRRLNGAFLTTHAFLAELVERGHQVDVVTTGNHDFFTYEGVNVHPRSRMTLLARQADLMLTHHGHDPLGSKWRGRRVTLAHGAHRPRELVGDLVWFGTAAVRDWYGWIGESVICPPPIDRRQYATEPGRSVTLVGLTRVKGVHLWEAVADALPDIPFLGVPSATGTQWRPLRPNVRCLPDMVTNMREVYFQTAVLLVPSENETYGRVGIEAMCSGIPVIAHPTPGMVEAYGDGATFISCRDTQKWIDVVRALASDADAYRRASARARLHVAGLDAQASVHTFADAVEAM